MRVADSQFTKVSRLFSGTVTRMSSLMPRLEGVTRAFWRTTGRPVDLRGSEPDPTYAARAPIHETFRVYVDAEGVLRTNHVLRLWPSTVVRLHYKLTPTRSEDFVL